MSPFLFLKKPLTAALFTIGLGVGLAPNTATARTVNAPAGMCEIAKSDRDKAVKEEIELIKKTHEMMEVSRSMHAKCMQKMNEIAGGKISEIDSGEGGAWGGILDSVGQIDEIFDLSGQVCSAIQSKVSEEQQKIASEIAKLEPYLDKATEIAGKGKEAIDRAKGDIDGVTDQAKDPVYQPPPQSGPTPAPPPRPPQPSPSHPAPPPPPTPPPADVVDWDDLNSLLLGD